MSAPTAPSTTSPPAESEDSSAPRLALKPESATPGGFVDGGWWPRSRSLGAELPALVPLLADRLGPVERVSFRLGDWDDAARAVRAGGNLVRLCGFRSQKAGTIDVLGRSQRVTLLVVPPGTSSEKADEALATAGRGDNADTVASMLTTAKGEFGATS